MQQKQQARAGQAPTQRQLFNGIGIGIGGLISSQIERMRSHKMWKGCRWRQLYPSWFTGHARTAAAKQVTTTADLCGSVSDQEMELLVPDRGFVAAAVAGSMITAATHDLGP